MTETTLTVFTRELFAVLYFFVPSYLANMAPVVARGHCEWLAIPMDGDRRIGGVRILGDHKTWRGFLAGVAVGTLAYAAQRALYDAGLLRRLALLDYGTTSVLPGVLLGIGTGIGDAAKSFVKRRIGIAPGDSWLGFDQVDFMIGSYLAVAPVCAVPLAATLAALPIVFAGSVLVTTVAYWLHLKEAWI